jgi:hypothetical protein
MPAGTLKVFEKAIHDFSCFGKAWMGSAAALLRRYVGTNVAA